MPQDKRNRTRPTQNAASKAPKKGARARTGRTGSRPQDAVPKQDERIVRETDRTVPVEPVKVTGKVREPMPEPAVDHRRQIVGTDEPKAQPPRRRA